MTVDDFQWVLVISSPGGEKRSGKVGKIIGAGNEASRSAALPGNTESASTTGRYNNCILGEKWKSCQAFIVVNERVAAAPDASSTGKPPAATSETFRGKDKIVETPEGEVKKMIPLHVRE